MLFQEVNGAATGLGFWAQLVRAFVKARQLGEDE